MHKVLVFKETLLPASETFILAQMKALSKYVPILAGLERAHPSLPLPKSPYCCRGTDPRSLTPEPSSIAEREPRRSFI